MTCLVCKFNYFSFSALGGLILAFKVYHGSRQQIVIDDNLRLFSHCYFQLKYILCLCWNRLPEDILTNCPYVCFNRMGWKFDMK